MAEWDPKGFTEGAIEAIRKRALLICNQMPPLNDLPHMEPRLLQLYHETYYTTLLGFHNVSIIMQGVLLEALVKEIIFENEKKDFKKAFGKAISHCDKKKYLDTEEIKFLTLFKDGIRNIYQHVDISALTRGMSIPGWKIPIDKNDVAGSILRGIGRIKKGEAGPPIKIKAKK